jgi:hypothetical protein
MTPSTPPLRKPNRRLGGLEVRICGFKIHQEHNLICTLPPGHQPRSIHATTAIADDKSVVAAVYDILKREVDMWQLVDPPESQQ